MLKVQIPTKSRWCCFETLWAPQTPSSLVIRLLQPVPPKLNNFLEQIATLKSCKIGGSVRFQTWNLPDFSKLAPVWIVYSCYCLKLLRACRLRRPQHGCWPRLYGFKVLWTVRRKFSRSRSVPLDDQAGGRCCSPSVWAVTAGRVAERRETSWTTLNRWTQHTVEHTRGRSQRKVGSVHSARNRSYKSALLEFFYILGNINPVALRSSSNLSLTTELWVHKTGTSFFRFIFYFIIMSQWKIEHISSVACHVTVGKKCWVQERQRTHLSPFVLFHFQIYRNRFMKIKHLKMYQLIKLYR